MNHNLWNPLKRYRVMGMVMSLLLVMCSSVFAENKEDQQIVQSQTLNEMSLEDLMNLDVSWLC